MNSLVFDDVVKEFKGTPVVNHISMNLTENHIYGLWGPNGSGKTMIMRLCLGLIYATSGIVSVDGKELGVDISFPPSVGFLLENPSFLDEYTGYENLKMLNAIKQFAKPHDICNALEAVGLDPSDRRKYRKYSLGMKQRLGIAAAVFERPELVLLDEPTNALDCEGVKQIENLILQLRKRGRIIILACHERNVLNRLSDEIFVISDGKIVEKLGGANE